MTDTSIAPNTVLSIELASGAVHVQTGGSGPGLLLLSKEYRMSGCQGIVTAKDDRGNGVNGV